MMNFWTPTWFPWNQNFSDADLPWEAKYDFVETYTWNEHTGGFDFHWRDDFDTFDQNKWYKSDNWGFEGNSSLFVTSNVETKDGNLILKLDKAPKTAHDDHHFLHEEYYAHSHDKWAPQAPLAHHGDKYSDIQHYAHHDAPDEGDKRDLGFYDEKAW